MDNENKSTDASTETDIDSRDLEELLANLPQIIKELEAEQPLQDTK
ncbi:hypothetical protein [Sporomusa aerivorans]